MFRESEGKKHTHKRIRNKWYQTFRHLSFSPLLLCIQIVQAEFIWWGLVFPPYPRFKRRSKGRPRSPGHTGNGRPCCWASFQHLMKNRFEFTRNSHTRPLVGTTRQGFDLGLKGILGNNNKKKPFKFAFGLLSANRKMKIAFPPIYLVMRAGIGFFFLGAWIILQTCRYHQFANSSPVFGAVVLLEHKLWFFVKLNCSLVCLIIIVWKRSISFTNWIIINFFKQ